MARIDKISGKLEDARKVLSLLKKGEDEDTIVKQEKRVKKLEEKKKGVKRGVAMEKRHGDKFKSMADKLVAGENTFKKRFLSKPKAKGPTPVSARKTLRGFAHSTGPLVREVEEREIVQDNRSQFFKRELERESRWLS